MTYTLSMGRQRRFVRRRVPVEDRFWELVPEGDGCREWAGTRDDYGYGVISTVRGGKPKQYRAHRLAYALSHGLPIDGLGGVVMHSCDNPPCCAPEHLSIGTSAENTADRHRKGRDASGARSGSALYPGLRRGERNGRAKLTAEQVNEIRTRYAAGGVSQQALGNEYGVTQAVVSAIILGKLWRVEL